MKIAVAAADGKTISAHFGRSLYFAIYGIHEGKIVNKKMRQNTFTGHFRGDHQEEHEHDYHGHHHHEGKDHQHKHQQVAEGLKDCDVVISHGMGRRAWEDLRAKGIEMIVTDETDADTAVQRYLKGELKDRTDMLH